MGAWGIGIFDNDTALDFSDMLQGVDDHKDIFENVIETVLLAGYVEEPDCCEMLVSAALIDNALHGTQYGDNEFANTFGKEHLNPDFNSLKPDAVKALQKVIGPKSELNELWLENEELYPAWRQNIEQLITRLS